MDPFIHKRAVPLWHTYNITVNILLKLTICPLNRITKSKTVVIIY